jgi:sortase B
MRNGTMFHNLRYFMDYDFFHAHPHIRVITKTQTLTYEIFAAFSAATDFDYIQVFFDPPEELQGLINELTARRNFDTKITPSIYDRILILSTCTNIQEDTRFVVAARLMNDAN